jgi:cellulose synthase/poly-beta-1,6-N-acetylglucosamine synthase-like glycosyltransferase
VILESVRSLLRSHYAKFELLVVNDGSTDGTLAVLSEAYRLVEDRRVPRARLETKPITRSYRSLDDERLVVIDEENGGSRADAVNAGLRYARYPLFLAVEADTLLDVDALPRPVREFQVRPGTVALGGIVRIANGSTVEAGHVTEARTPRDLLVNLQIVEYLRAFLVGRTGWSRIGAILIVSGAFGIFRREHAGRAGRLRPRQLRRGRRARRQALPRPRRDVQDRVHR